MRRVVEIRGVALDEVGPLADALAALGVEEVELLDEGGASARLVGVVVGELDVARAARTLGVPLERLVVHDASAATDWASVPVLGPRARWFGPLRVEVVTDDAPGTPGSLVIDARGAFGSGLHPSTALVLEAVVERRPAELLDVGTGSGILVLAALRLGAERAVALDVDPAALDAARRNARRNGLDDDRLTLGLDAPDALGRTFGFVVSNILSQELAALAPRVVRALGPRATLWLSGLRPDQVDETSAAYARLGLHRLRLVERAGWVAVELVTSW